MVDGPRCRANRRNAAYIHDVFKFVAAPKRLNKAILREKYAKSNLSAAQVGEEFGLSKQAVLARLRSAGVSKSSGRGRAKDNYRFPNPGYGHKVVNGRLESNTAEMKTVRLIVELRDRRQWPFVEIAEELRRRNLVTRQGAEWNRYIVSRVYRVWTGKL